MKRIKKTIIFLLFVLLVMPFTFNVVYAEDCSDVMAAVNELEEVNQLYSTYECDNTNDSQSISICNTIKIKKTTLLEKLFEYNDEGTCSSIDLSSIISDYENNCSNRFSSKLKVITDSVMKLFFISAPFIIIIFGSLDFFKIITGSNPDEAKKHRTNFIKRLIAFVLLYLTPFIVEKLFSITPYNINGVNYVCTEDINFGSTYTASEISGIYGGNNYSNGGNGQIIADAAKELLQYAHDNNFQYGCPSTGFETSFSPSNKGKQICCATLASAAIYKAGIEEIKGLGGMLHSSPGLASYLDKLDWIFITNKEDLQPGDIVFFLRTSNCTKVSVRGTPSLCPGHVEVYAGDGKTYSAGSTNNIRNNIDYLDRDNFVYAFRYPGKKK